MSTNSVFFKFFWIILLLLVQPYSAFSSARGALDALGIPRPGSEPAPKDYSLNLVSSNELKRRLTRVFSRSVFYPSFFQLIEKSEMTSAIHNFYNSFYDRYAVAKSKQQVLNSFSDMFIEFVTEQSEANNLPITDEQISNLRAVIYDVLAPKNNTCSKYLTK